MKEFTFSDKKIKDKAELLLQEQNENNKGHLEGQPNERSCRADEAVQFISLYEIQKNEEAKMKEFLIQLRKKFKKKWSCCLSRTTSQTDKIWRLSRGI
jgi:hypothetical protein